MANLDELERRLKDLNKQLDEFAYVPEYVEEAPAPVEEGIAPPTEEELQKVKSITEMSPEELDKRIQESGIQATTLRSLATPQEGESEAMTTFRGGALLADQIGTIVGDHVPLTVARMIRNGDKTLGNVGMLDNWVTTEQEEAASKRYLSEKQREKVWLSLPVFGDIKFGDVEDMSESFGYSIANALATGGGAVAMSKAGAAAGVAGGPAGAAIGAVGGMLAGVFGGTRASRDQFIEQLQQKFVADHGGVITPELQKKWDAYYEQIQDDATLYGLWEAVPETASNIISFGILKAGNKAVAPVLDKIKSDLARKVGSGAAKAVAMYSEEGASEVLTTQKQSEIEARMGLRERPLNYGEAWEEVKAQVGLMTTLMGGFGALAIRPTETIRPSVPDNITSPATKQLMEEREVADKEGNPKKLAEIDDMLSQSIRQDIEQAQADLAVMQKEGVALDPNTISGQRALANEAEGLPINRISGAVDDQQLQAMFEQFAAEQDGPTVLPKQNQETTPFQEIAQIDEQISNIEFERASGNIPNEEANANLKTLAERRNEVAKKVSNKAVIMDSLSKQLRKLDEGIKNEESKRVFGFLDQNEEDKSNKKLTDLNAQRNSIALQVANAERYGHLVPENEAWRLFGLNPAQMEQKIAQDEGTTPSALRARVEQERAKRIAKQQENKRKMDLAARVAGQKFKRRQKIAEQRAVAEEAALNQQIAQLESQEEAGIVADIAIEQAPERTRKTPFRDIPIIDVKKEAPAPKATKLIPSLELAEKAKKIPFAKVEDKRVDKTEKKAPSRERTPLKKRIEKREVIMSSANTPYKTREAAINVINKIGKSAPLQYKVIEVKDGYAIQKKAPSELLGPRYERVSSKMKDGVDKINVQNEVIKAVRNVSKIIKSKVKIRTLQHPKDLKALYPEYYKLIEKDGDLDSIRGLYINGDIFLFSKNITRTKVSPEEIILHELRHFVFDAMRADPSFNNLLDRVIKGNRKDLERYLGNINRDFSREDLEFAAEEFLVNQYRKGVKTDFITKFTAFIQEFLSKVFGRPVGQAEVKMFLNELDSVIYDSEEIQEKRFERLQPAYDREAPRTSTEELNEYFTPVEKTFKDKALEFSGLKKDTKFSLGTQIASQLVAKSVPIRLKQEQYNYETGKRTEAYQKVRVSASTGSVADAYLNSGIPEWVEGEQGSGWITVNKNGQYKGLITELKVLGPNVDAFMREMLGLRILEERKREAEINAKRIKDGKKPLAPRKYFGKDVEDSDVLNGIFMDAAVAKEKVGEATWKRMQDVLSAYTDRKLELAVKSGLLNEEEVNQWKRNIYVPLFRVMEQKYDALGADRRGNMVMGALINDGINQLKAQAKEKVGDPLENFIGNYNFMMNEILKNIARRDTISMLLELGDGSVELVKQKPSQHNKNIVSVQVSGKTLYAKINDDLIFDALVDIAPAWSQNPFFKVFFTKPKQLLTAAITNNPVFWVKNFVRDAVSSVVLTGNLKVTDPIVGLYKALTNHSDYVSLKGSGGAFTGYDLTSKRGVKEIVKEARGQGSTLGNMWRSYRQFGSAIENAIRVQEYARAKEKEAKEATAAFEARDILDFSERGQHPLLNLIIGMVPFLNARIQGLNKISKSYRKDRAGVLLRGGLLTAAALALYAANKDDERYKALSDYERFNNLHIFFGKEHFQFPMPFEVGAVFMSGPVAMAEALDSEYGGKHFLNWLGFTANNTLAFDPTPQALKPLVELAINENKYTGRQIVPAAEQKLEAFAQYSPVTSHTAKAIGKSLNVSPRKVEHIIQGYTASAGRAMLGMSDLLLKSMGYAEDRPYDGDKLLSALGRDAFYVTQEKGSRYEDELRKRLPEVMLAVNTYKKMRRTGEYEEALKQLKKEGLTEGDSRYYRTVFDRVNARNQDAIRIINNKLMSQDKKMELLNDINDENLKRFRDAYHRLSKEGRL